MKPRQTEEFLDVNATSPDPPPTQDFTPTGAYSEIPARGFDRRKLLFAIPILVIVLTAAVFVFKNITAGKPAEKLAERPVVTVTTETAQLRPFSKQVTVNGAIWAWDPLAIGSEINGLRI